MPDEEQIFINKIKLLSSGISLSLPLALLIIYQLKHLTKNTSTELQDYVLSYKSGPIHIFQRERNKEIDKYYKQGYLGQIEQLNC